MILRKRGGKEGIKMRVILFLLYLSIISFSLLMFYYGKPVYGFTIERTGYDFHVPFSSIFGLIWVVSMPLFLACFLAEITEWLIKKSKRG